MSKHTVISTTGAAVLLGVGLLMAFSASALETVVQVGTTYVDAGASAQDNYDGDISTRVVTANTVNTARVGTYSVTYTVSDSSGNTAAPVVRTVKVVDTTAPVIALNGSANVTVTKGASYTDAGATATDNYDGDITSKIVTSNSVNTSVEGTYTVTFNVSDTSGNAAAQVARTVVVKGSTDTTKPVITLIGSNNVKIRIGTTYTDAGATATDNVDGNITANIVTNSSVNNWWPGTYKVTYNVSDAAGNAADPVTRIVKVTFFKTDDDSELAIASPVDRATYFVSSNASSAPLTLTAVAPSGAASVEYAVDGTPVGSATDAPFAVTVDMDLASFGWGEHHVAAVAKFTTTEETVSAESVFTLAPVAAGEDANGNGIPDNPFATLPLEGDMWMHTVTVAETGKQKAVSMMRFEGLSDDETSSAPVTMVVDLPGDASRSATVMVPREVLAGNETGIVLVSVAADLDTLFGTDQAALLMPEPKDYALANGGFYVEVNVLTTTDNGVTFGEVSESTIALNPVSVTMQGVQTAEGSSVSLQKHPMYVESDSTTGVTVIAQDGEWSDTHVENLAVESDTLSADLTSLSVFAPYEKTGDSAVPSGCVGGSLNMTVTTGMAGDLILLASAILALLAVSGRKAAPSARGTRMM